jgi:hypothetical protein
LTQKVSGAGLIGERSGVDVEVRPDGILVTVDKSKTQQPEPAKKLAGDKRRARCPRRSSTQRRMDMRESPKHRRELLKQAVDTRVRWMKIRAEEQGLAWLDDAELPLRQSINPT